MPTRAFTCLALLAALAAADVCKVLPNAEEGCNVAPLGCTCPTPFYECNTGGGSCLLSVCSGVCRLSTIGYAIVIGVPLLILVLLVLFCCCCCACCSRGGGGGAREREVIIIQAPSYGNYAAADDWAKRGAGRG